MHSQRIWAGNAIGIRGENELYDKSTREAQYEGYLMAKQGSNALLGEAQQTLRDLSYQILYESSHRDFSQQVFSLIRDGVKEIALIQCRSENVDNRYVVGVILKALKAVDCVVLYFRGREKLVKIPAQLLLQIHDECKYRGQVAYTGDRCQQWRIDIHLSDKELSPQNSGGLRYSIAPYVIKVVPKWPRARTIHRGSEPA